MKRDIRIRQHTVRIVTTSEDYGSSTFRPGVRFFLTGPNGSPAGIGPKAWPGHMRVRQFRNAHNWAKTGWARQFRGTGAGYSWTNSLYVPLPHIKWRQAYRLRRFGALHLYRWQYWLAKRAL